MDATTVAAPAAPVAAPAVHTCPRCATVDTPDTTPAERLAGLVACLAAQAR